MNRGMKNSICGCEHRDEERRDDKKETKQIEELAVEDSIIVCSQGNITDKVKSGIVVEYSGHYAGLCRDPSSKRFVLFCDDSFNDPPLMSKKATLELHDILLGDKYLTKEIEDMKKRIILLEKQIKRNIMPNIRQDNINTSLIFSEDERSNYSEKEEKSEK